MLKSISVVLAMLAALVSSAASTQQLPTFPSTVRFIVPFAAGGGTDAFARVIATQLGARLGRNVIVENRAGAGTLIGSTAVAKSPADGSTFDELVAAADRRMYRNKATRQAARSHAATAGRVFHVAV